ncbi:cystatin-F isoform X1 [Prionailurus viverrinus]|uniref:Cystatin-F isoform X4 n=1 Tax=Puma concolor TaxID=9696 RepID=A0A6P6IIH2_PUMCO|nr:cystatin-F isoform X4 [Puma concolor]XP_047708125.1 cystatin-F isoform X1 [Prionailurus viverrinus]
MRRARELLAFCCLVLSTTGRPSRVLCFSLSDFCAQTLNSDVKPGFPKTINPNDSAVLKAARHSVERFNNCTNDIFLFKESHISRALVQGPSLLMESSGQEGNVLDTEPQSHLGTKNWCHEQDQHEWIVKGLKYMLDMEIGRTSCKKTQHPSLDNCDFQTNHTLQRTFSCYSEVWVIPWLQRFEVPVLHCQ